MAKSVTGQSPGPDRMGADSIGAETIGSVMAGSGPYPPPGAGNQWPPPGYGGPPPPPQRYGVPPGPGVPPPRQLAAAHKPGAIPLRPLGLGDLYDGAFKVIRRNPAATVGSAVLVSAVAMAIPVLVTAVLTWTVDLSLIAIGDTTSETDLFGVLGVFGSYGVGAVLQGIGLILVTGMVAKVVAAAALGRRLSLGEAWRETRGRRWRLIGLTVLLGLAVLVVLLLYALLWIAVVAVGELVAIVVFGLVSVPLFLAFLCWFWIRVYYLPAVVLMLEDSGVLQTIRRGHLLTRGAFWRTFGIGLLTLVVTQVAGSILSAPVSMGGQILVFVIDAEYQMLTLMLSQALATVIAAAFTIPFVTAVTSLQYLDLRMRKEAYDVELLARAGITVP